MIPLRGLENTETGVVHIQGASSADTLCGLNLRGRDPCAGTEYEEADGVPLRHVCARCHAMYEANVRWVEVQERNEYYPFCRRTKENEEWMQIQSKS